MPSAGFGLVNVIAPLRLDASGSGAVLVGAIFLAAVGLEAIASPVAGRLADRRGALWPARAGLVAGGISLALLPLPRTVALLAVLVIVAAPMIGTLWTPAMTVLAEGAEIRGVDPAFAFGLANMAWGAGAAIGAGAGAALADATSDAVSLLLVALVMLGTAVAVRGARPIALWQSSPENVRMSRSGPLRHQEP